QRQAARAAAGFAGAGRRFQRLGRSLAGALVVDDYAHHPTEVRATLAAARTELDGGRLFAAFQPHLFTRTARLAQQLGAALALADVIAVLDVYPSRERAEEHPGVSGLLVARAAAEASAGGEVLWLPGLRDAARALERRLGARDVCVVMGAGDVDALARSLVRDPDVCDLRDSEARDLDSEARDLDAADRDLDAEARDLDATDRDLDAEARDLDAAAGEPLDLDAAAGEPLDAQAPGS
ncbi:MAG: glutamate ligase domain-containing protein, partial [Solirubrobacteraceae bacterium]